VTTTSQAPTEFVHAFAQAQAHLMAAALGRASWHGDISLDELERFTDAAPDLDLKAAVARVVASAIDGVEVELCRHIKAQRP
jgi:hypothetical protein